MAGSMLVVSMMTLLSSLPVRMFPSCFQVIEVSGTLKIVIVTDKVNFPPAVTRRGAVCPLASSTRGGTNEAKQNAVYSA